MSKNEPVTNSIEEFLAQSCRQVKFKKYIVALSGGLDSVCLLHALIPQVAVSNVIAIYIDHQLQSESVDWMLHNQQVCDNLGVEFKAISVSINRNKASLEQEARVERYRAFSQLMDEHSCLLTGHHQQDQSETLLLQLFRGAGSKGLSAMPKITPFEQGWHARPLLSVSRTDIEAYVAEHKLSYVEDPSNQQLDIRRNFIRHKVTPLLKKTWPQLDKTLENVSQTQAENQKLLDELAVIDMQSCLHESELLVAELQKVNPLRQNNILRFWLATNNKLMPSRKVLEQIRKQLIESREDSSPNIDLDEHCLKRYQGKIYLIAKSSLVITTTNEKKVWEWLVDKDFDQIKELAIEAQKLLTINPDYKGKTLKVTLRNEGERFKPNGAEHSISVKKYLQRKNIPPWLRDLTLLVWDGDTIVWVQEASSSQINS